ncbi:lycopene cyclase domain-containing protein [Glaciihabitans tibetensis]|uniref:Lycopene cyclase domain-containing protein n=1 Tax=Glaciihabitans tibetensis TaxID=1266600 RepID=A0A2T0VD00_9MICO|nr:lycopene cyclase domain-containing protein [Glaciihabitans tibetensis]PRY68046.1 lycopene cyclase domain-containing protein [Glaciihabitans tibetensis]
MGLIYLGALAISLTGMVVLDRRFTLFFWQDARRASIVLAAGVVFFLVWDLFGIGLGIFFRGETSFMTGLQLAPELPVEELFFLILLCYQTMNVFAAAVRVVDAAGRRRAARNNPTTAPSPVRSDLR